MLPHVWSVVVAGEEDNHLASVTRNMNGVAVPKQFCRFAGGRSLLERALHRAERVSSVARTVVVVTRGHAPWWSDQLDGRLFDNVIIQSDDRGTAPAVLLAAAHILRRDPSARLVVMRADHHYSRDAAFVHAVQRAVRANVDEPEHITLLGLIPEDLEAGRGWIVPDRIRGNGAARGTAFVPASAGDARRLLQQGAMWNPSVFVGLARAFHDLAARTAPTLCARIDDCVAAHRTECSYRIRHLARRDLEHAVLAGALDSLRVLPVPSCGWSDASTPERLHACLSALSAPRRPLHQATLRGIRAVG